ncbi:serine/threonine-protein kinase H1 homolog [Octopus bimaculoides]|uniref:serine/threonine-protein kinase H1 homolog n=1 Tax=Octopus bimaculoides TaxID=37653 RepID=UPI00071D9D5B|nr:serine/threonine-protein kinase H1 homolog [Octopus bimaculoides]|eukprot:XP_014769309.1 PREDICTED: serine/threonine-protein kinase H1 homolog [Octopus bimaculoides]
MGCLNTKLVPESPPSQRSLNYVYHGPQNIYKSNSNYTNHHKPKEKKCGNKQWQHSQQQQSGNNIQDTPRHNKRVEKYMATFDNRVTAKYDIKALIGRGSFSKIVRVEHKITKQPYAIKMINRTEGREVFESELNVLRRVRHPNIIQLVEVFECKQKVYMVMELATGGDLLDRIIGKGYFSEADAITVLKMVFEGVRYLHSLGITHRDLKPENLLYYHPGNDSKIMITDFGLSATRKGPDNWMNTACGTPEYIAPEILARKPYTSQVDLWAVGVITFILLSGEMPFEEDNKTRLFRLILKAKYNYARELWKHVSNMAKDFIDRLLVLEPKERMTSSQAIAHAWLRSHGNQSSYRNLQHTNSSNSTQSSKSSNKSNRSGRSLRSEHRHVHPEEIEELHRDPEILADIASMGY